ncbi:MAG: hypothetical protein JW803_06075 [Endomicrobiales bacterium]|nr:hypothetical protein [Endomicrobiales bacterium]
MDTERFDSKIRNALKRALPFLAISLLILLVYNKAMFFGLTFLDDNIIIPYGKAQSLDLKTITGLFKRVLLPDYFNFFYRPLLMVSFIADAGVFESFPFIFHVTNLALHLCGSLLLYVLLLKMDVEKYLALFLAMVFAVHPVLTQAVAWIPGRNDSLLGVFVFAAFIFYIAYRGTGRVRNLFLHLICFTAAMFVKETAVVIVPMAFFYDWLIAKRRSFADLRLPILSWAVIASVWWLMRSAALSQLKWQALDFGFPDYAGNVLRAVPLFLYYVGKVLFPVNLSNYPARMDTTLWYGIAAAVVICAALWFSRGRRDNRVAFGALWAFLFLMPTFVTPDNPPLEHRFYVSFAGLLIVFSEIRISLARNTVKGMMAGAVIAALAVITLGYENVFSGRRVFWDNIAKTSPSNPLPCAERGMEFLGQGALREAALEFERAYDMSWIDNKQRRLIHAFNLAQLYKELGEFEKSEKLFEEIVSEVRSGNSKMYYYYALLKLKQGDTGVAERLLQEAIRINPHFIDYYAELVRIYQKRGENKKSDAFIETLVLHNDGAPDDTAYIEESSAKWFAGVLRARESAQR